MEFAHTPVLLNEVIAGLNLKSTGIYVDATIGGAGHSYQILSRLTTGHLYGFDQDATAIETSRAHLQTLSLNNFTLFHKNFEFIKEELEKIGVTRVDGILFDLGVSSFQFDAPERGFSYRHDAKLDMRMNQDQGFSAYDIVNTYSEADLARILFTYGEEKYARSIARKIVAVRSERAITTTFELVDIIRSAVPSQYLKGTHPAKKTFQALRIETNNELGILQESLEKALSLLNHGGRLAVISFHSLEDRLVKDVFNKYAKETQPNRFAPINLTPEKLDYKLITKKPILPSEMEVNENRRSHSAKLRIIERF
ncbi:MAG: 16S rRNA (cytosine(1402)-N(4))-methyltransferase RsmH [Bacilli bacterium]|jgi:16S rRNA (cytosine1402-N4)-methyltransferase|nr:16S rRNA (cytosine(1402)-N(4))-methyltransferase RsmH [Bacilli bacterium]MDD3422252.1 16S rRNA (cytosine(1402)-N(4))-methyltransferase RsmH [Bacilli bacterium]MDD4065555.1 16S rRNA (cytosine(1402)-N(4))-methyltransferase RsmH [Bacilli bacterium]